MLCAIWYHLYKLKNVKNTHGGVLLLVNLQDEACNLLKLTLLHGCFPRFLNCNNCTKLGKASYVYSDIEPFSPSFNCTRATRKKTVYFASLWNALKNMRTLKTGYEEVAVMKISFKLHSKSLLVHCDVTSVHIENRTISFVEIEAARCH